MVTGASKGVGKGISPELARSGCDVAVNYHSARVGGEDAAAEISAMGRRALAVLADVGNSAATSRMFHESLRVLPVPGHPGKQCRHTGLEAAAHLEESEWDRVIATNLKGCFPCTQLAARGVSQPGEQHRQ